MYAWPSILLQCTLHLLSQCILMQKKNGVLLCIFFLDESEVKVQCLTHAPMQLLEFQTSLL